jgi:hypothetical protein
VVQVQAQNNDIASAEIEVKNFPTVEEVVVDPKFNQQIPEETK